MKLLELLEIKKRIGIGVRLAIMVAVLMTLFPGSFTIFSVISRRSEAMEMFVNSSMNMGRSLERILRLSMLENRRDAIEVAVKDIAREEAIDAITLVTHTGEPIYASNAGPHTAVSLDDGRCSGCHLKNQERPLGKLPPASHVHIAEEAKLAKVVIPIYNAPDCYTSDCHAHSEDMPVLGVMQLDVSYADVEASLASSLRNLIVFSSLVALATFIAIILLIRQWVTNPVRDLLRGIRRVADGDLGHVIPAGEAELGALAQAFNKMQDRLESSQRQLITAEKLASIGKLAASVAHEINNPLTGILTFAEDLVDESKPDDPRVDDYKVIRREAIRCREIVRQLLDFSRDDKPNFRSVDMNEILSHMVTFVSKQAIFRNVNIGTDFQSDLPPVTADSTQLEQVILGILVNASEAMPEGGGIRITSSTANQGKEVEVCIRDTGPGIPEEHLHRIFEPFFSTKGGSSLGIGLGVSWNIINQHGGRLEADSTPGEGTTFRITMPSASPGDKTEAAI